MSKPVPLPAPWVRTARGNPCPVCHCHAGCLLSSNTDASAVICANVSSAQQIGAAGYLHILRDSPPWSPWSRSLARLARMEPQ